MKKSMKSIMLGLALVCVVSFSGTVYAETSQDLNDVYLKSGDTYVKVDTDFSHPTIHGTLSGTSDSTDATKLDIHLLYKNFFNSQSCIENGDTVRISIADDVSGDYVYSLAGETPIVFYGKGMGSDMYYINSDSTSCIDQTNQISFTEVDSFRFSDGPWSLYLNGDSFDVSNTNITQFVVE
ncbi:hypothetical protein [Mechercharimyces sp. CAU 1602]|uniref:hypothetical protein n=1 Tax=Mechercharimyces sp. CAU 1602 TaxID=2973933 RepID=UPI002161582A|nr:hypothetical protein [Mechercharimyces sp. CAU 1602]MCS1350055.1 hypothetical protein [Mechercharimyces sp. CAU 1602]